MLFVVLLFFSSACIALDPNNKLHDTAHYKRHEEADFVVPCVLKLLEMYFKSDRALKGSLSIVGMTSDPTLIERSTLRILNEGKRHNLAVMVKDPMKKMASEAHVTDIASNYFILLSKSGDLPLTMKMLSHLPTWNPLANVAVLFTNIFNDTHLEAESMIVLRGLFNYSMYNVNIMSQRKGSYVIQTYTYFPYEQDNCATSVKNIKMINECYNEKEDQKDDENLRVTNFHEEEFPKIPHKLHGCYLNVSVSLNAPYVVATKRNDIERGLEILMLKQIAKEMDLTLKYKIINQEVINSLTTSNATHGIYSNILQGFSDIMVGGLHENGVSRQILSSSVPYYQDDLTWCVPPAALASNLTNVIGIFNLATWIITLAIIGVSGLLILLYSRREELQNSENFAWSLIISLSFILGNSSHFFPNRIFVQVFLTFLMFFGLHFNVIYHSFLITVLTKPRYEPQIATIEMAVQDELKFYGNEDTLEHFKEKAPTDQISKSIISNFKICKDLDTCMGYITANRKTAIAVSRQHADNNPSISTSDMFCFKKVDNIYTFSVSMLTKKDYHLLSKINDIIRTISESGLLMKWQHDSEKKVIPTVTNQGGEGGDAIKLKIKHVQGGFLVWAIGLLLATIALGFEWIVYFLRKQLTKKKKKQLNK